MLMNTEQLNQSIQNFVFDKLDCNSDCYAKLSYDPRPLVNAILDFAISIIKTVADNEHMYDLDIEDGMRWAIDLLEKSKNDA